MAVTLARIQYPDKTALQKSARGTPEKSRAQRMDSRDQGRVKMGAGFGLTSAAASGAALASRRPASASVAEIFFCCGRIGPTGESVF